MFYETTQRHILEEISLHRHNRESLNCPLNRTVFLTGVQLLDSLPGDGIPKRAELESGYIPELMWTWHLGIANLTSSHFLRPKYKYTEVISKFSSFYICKFSRPVLGPTQPSIHWVRGPHSRGVKRPGHEADYSSPTNAEVKNMCIYTSTPHTPS
jgi:hypothetical protein